jgi:hypothetical protein
MSVSIKESILITGTGRCGTTFLMALFTLLGMDTGFTRETLKENIHDKVKGGLEEQPGKYTIAKNPAFIFMIESYILHYKQVPKMVIIPVRNFNESVESRYKNTEELGLLDEPKPVEIGASKGAGGLWNADTKEEQILFYNKCMAYYIQAMTRCGIPTKFIDFHYMTTNSRYLFESLKDVIDPDVTYERFDECYREATSLCAR